jgi:hypothetical protein
MESGLAVCYGLRSFAVAASCLRFHYIAHARYVSMWLLLQKGSGGAHACEGGGACMLNAGKGRGGRDGLRTRASPAAR